LARWSTPSSRCQRPDTAIRRYEHNNVTIEVTPSVKGIATIFDKDILIYVVSQLVAKKNGKVPLHRTVQLRAYDLLVLFALLTMAFFDKPLHRLRLGVWRIHHRVLGLAHVDRSSY
jgi:plasmid replication initiation protein